MLGLGENAIGDRGTAALAASSNLAHLRELYLYENEISDIGATALAVSPFLANLTRLQLPDNAITSRGIRICFLFALSPTIGTLPPCPKTPSDRVPGTYCAVDTERLFN